jgi:hypothetical protein
MTDVTDCATDQQTFGHRRDPSYRRGLHEGACLALRLVDDGWPGDTLVQWLRDVDAWRYASDAGELPPMPQQREGAPDGE